MSQQLPEHAKGVLAFLEGGKNHSGATWARGGWAFMVRWTHGAPPDQTVKDGWSLRHYEKALAEMDADYAEVVEWAYLSDLREHMTKVGDEE